MLEMIKEIVMRSIRLYEGGSGGGPGGTTKSGQPYAT